jgi:hypothetical protein
MPAEPKNAGYWDLEAFLDSLILELDKAQDTLAMKGLTRRLTYTVKDAALELQIFPRYDDGRIRFATARPGEAGASRLSIQLGSITDNQIRESANEPLRADDVPIDAIEIDPEVKESLKKVGVTSSRDLERINRRNVNVTEIVAEKTGKKQTVDYSELAHMINKARRRRSSPRIERVSTASSLDATELVFEGEHLADDAAPDFPVASVNGERVNVVEATSRTLRLAVPPNSLRAGENLVEVALDPYAVMKLHVKT